MENTKTTFRPILFSTPMVQAILEGRKTMTRRTKGLADSYPKNVIFERSNGWPKQGNWIAKYKISSNPDRFEIENIIKCPYQVGDVFWVRETFYKTIAEELKGAFFYKADIDKLSWTFKWKPSIFMPKEACRIFLKIKSIRVERLQDISEEDAKAEGVNCLNPFWQDYTTPESFFLSPGASFISLWELINGIQSVENNPFVFVYEFEQIEKPLDFIV